MLQDTGDTLARYDTVYNILATMEIYRITGEKATISLDGPNPLSFLEKDSTDKLITMEVIPTGGQRVFYYCDIYWIVPNDRDLPQYWETKKYQSVISCLPIHIY